MRGMGVNRGQRWEVSLLHGASYSRLGELVFVICLSGGLID